MDKLLPGGCVPSYYICDGWEDCVDAGDEAGCSGNRTSSDDINQDKKASYIDYQTEQQRRLDNPIATAGLNRDEDCGGSGPDVGCDSECFSGLVDDCAGECGGSSALDDCGVCDGGNADQDCAGDCFGDATEDCAGDCNGSSAVDNCGSCDDIPFND